MNRVHNVYIRFECPRDDVEGPILGPYPFVQVTYDELRVGPDGDVVAVLDESGDWELTIGAGEYTGQRYSDFVVYAE